MPGSPMTGAASSPLRLESLRTRADFLRAQRGFRRSLSALGLEMCATPEALARPGACRAGFTASRKVGGAVARNRAKRRLRAAASAVLSLYGRERHDYVLIAREATLMRPFAALLGDLASAVNGVHAAEDRAGAEPGKGRAV